MAQQDFVNGGYHANFKAKPRITHFIHASNQQCSTTEHRTLTASNTYLLLVIINVETILTFFHKVKCLQPSPSSLSLFFSFSFPERVLFSTEVN